jgi:hypothetical protein
VVGFDQWGFCPMHSSPVGPASALPAGEGSLGKWLSSGSVIALDGTRRGGAEVCGEIRGRWRNGSKRPVLKHGPRSLTSMRVFGPQARPRNESERRREPLEGAPSTGPGVSYRRI